MLVHVAAVNIRLVNTARGSAANQVRVIIETWSRKLRAKYFVSPTPKSCPKYCGGLTPNSGRYLLSPGAISGIRP